MDERTVGRRERQGHSPAHRSSGPFHHTGLVLAAGASSRMGSPKALLPAPGGPLAMAQARHLRDAGCSRVLIVLGADAQIILRHLRGFEVVINPDWTLGRLSSVQTGLRAVAAGAGALILPVDTVGVRADTLRAILRDADTGGADAVRPMHLGRPGRILWLGPAAIRDVLAMAPGESERLDQVMRPRERLLDVDDPAVLHNINTRDEWDRWLRELPAQ